MAFRMSPGEAMELDSFARMSGLCKQDYLIDRALQREITVVPSARLFKMLQGELQKVLVELQRIEAGSTADPYLLDIIGQINRTMAGLKEESKAPQRKKQKGTGGVQIWGE